MAQQEQEPTPAGVAALATQTVRLERFALLGVFGTESAPAALIRQPDGSTLRVTPGDETAGGTVLSIDAERVILSRGSGQRVLRLPRG